MVRGGGAGGVDRFAVPLYTVVSDLLPAVGLRLKTLSEVYGIPADEDVADVDWLELAGLRYHFSRRSDGG